MYIARITAQKDCWTLHIAIQYQYEDLKMWKILNICPIFLTKYCTYPFSYFMLYCTTEKVLVRVHHN